MKVLVFVQMGMEHFQAMHHHLTHIAGKSWGEKERRKKKYNQKKRKQQKKKVVRVLVCAYVYERAFLDNFFVCIYSLCVYFV